MVFLKSAWKLLVAVKDGLVLLLLIAFFTLIYAAIRLATPSESVPGGGALLLTLDGPIVEQPANADRVSMLTGDVKPREIRLRDVVRAIETAAQDSAIKAIVIDAGFLSGGGQVAMMRIGTALDRARAAGKPVLIQAGVYDDDAYMLGGAFQRCVAGAAGHGGGYRAAGGSGLYYKGLIDKVGANVHVYRVGTYKSFVEPYLRADQSEPAREASQALVSAVWDNWLANVAKARPKARLGDYIQNPLTFARSSDGDLAKAALAGGLVDKLGDRTAFGEHVATIVGASADGDPLDFRAVPLASYLARHPQSEAGRVAVVTIAGDIVDGEAGPGAAGGTSVSELIHDALSDDATKALVLRVDSPGGSVTAAEEIRNAAMEARTAKIPVVVSMANVAASGGYWISTAADRIFAEPSTITGSIGVFGIIPSFEATLAKIGVTTDGVKTTPLSGEPDIAGGINPIFDSLAQASVENIYARFVGLVAAARHMSAQQVDRVAQGRVWDGGSARQLGLIDQFGGLDDAVAAAAKLAGLEGAAAQARFVDPKPDRLSQLITSLTSGDSGRASDAVRSRAMNWLDVAAARRQATAARAMGDIQALVSGPAMRADCLECRSFLSTGNERQATPQGVV